ncbi:S8 family serine peptidase [Pedobacter glucosidilyticus]|uniref:S8 family serine peptidase n=1 Tax=Pedobacter glucosidilyticus TaxID=1122941 RepID=UPI0004796495|nr:S8 family serine peptidase [Pedobacter glucosidilyticus]
MRISSSLLMCFWLFSVFTTLANDGLKKKFKLPAGVTAKDIVPNSLIIKYKNISTAATRSVQNNIASGKQKIQFLKHEPVVKLNRIYELPIQKQLALDKVGLNKVYEIEYRSSQSIENVINTLLEQEEVEYAEPRYIYHTSSEPNDPFFQQGTQNHLLRVNAVEAWNIQNAANGQIIAVVDSGADLEHEDLAANIYLNNNDPVNGIDDDGDGYIDNYRGWDFVGASFTNGRPDNNPDIPSDSLDHGMHVAGIASAVANNGIGIASLAKDAKLMILKAGSDDNATAIYRGYEAILYAVNKGVKIINCSWGGPGFSAYGQDVINFAVSNGCLVIAAAGNSAKEGLDYPAAYNGVLAVANVNNSDIKSSSSSYGFDVDIAAPGQNIWSTLNNDTYGTKSGTSMATPLVSSAAALVAAKYPQLSGPAIGEILRLSTDNIYTLSGNSNFVNKLGKGRLNIAKALESTPAIAIRKQNIILQDNSDGVLAGGDTVELAIDLKSILGNVSNLNVTLSTDNPDVTVITSNLVLTQLNQDETKQLGFFKVFLAPRTQENVEVIFKLQYASSNYQDEEFFALRVNLDYLNINENQIATTLTSNGRVGFSAQDAQNGLGFVYQNKNLLYEASLMIGNSTSRISNNARAPQIGRAEEDFLKITRPLKEIDDTNVLVAASTFNDYSSNSPLDVQVINKHYAYKNAPDDKYVIVEYLIKNNSIVPLNGLYVGLFCDWDIDNSEENIVKYRPDKSLAYTYSVNPGNPYTAVKVLNTNASVQFYPMSYQLVGDILEDDSFTRAEKFTSLSSGIFKTELGESLGGLDVMYTMGVGPYNVASKDSIQVAFAFIGGDNLNDIILSADAAQEKFEGLQLFESEPVLKFEVSQNYPNPTKGNTFFDVALPEAGSLFVDLYDITGKKIKQIYGTALMGSGKHTISTTLNDLSAGIYFAEFQYRQTKQVVKLILTN